MPDKTARLYDHGPDALRYIISVVHRRELENLIDEYRPDVRARRRRRRLKYGRQAA